MSDTNTATDTKPRAKIVAYEVRNLVHDTFLFGGQLLVPNGRMRVSAERFSECEVQLSKQVRLKHVAVRGLDAQQDAALQAEITAKAGPQKD